MAGNLHKQESSFTHTRPGPTPAAKEESIRVVSECYCHNGHSLISDRPAFAGFNGITVKLRSEGQAGILSLSPVIGDLDRTFFNFERREGEIIEICCPTCDEPLPYYDQCNCGAYLVTFFTAARQDFANAIGICQRIGCLHSKIITNYNLRKYSRMGYY